MTLRWIQAKSVIIKPIVMIKVYGMMTCPDCVEVDEQVKGDSRYEIIDIGEHVRFMKEFLRLRDNNEVFAEARAKGYAGIPCFCVGRRDCNVKSRRSRNTKGKE